MYYCSYCDLHTDTPEWDGKFTVCPECGKCLWEVEHERKKIKEATEGMRTLDEALEERPRKGKVSHRKTRTKGVEERCAPWHGLELPSR
jgi:transcription initiation factor IIE alpha subunit